MGLVSKIIGAVVLQVISTCLSVMVLGSILLKWFKVGNAIFSSKPRPTPPTILEDPKWGSHGYITLKKQAIKIHYVEKGDRGNPLMLCLHGFPEFWFSWRYQLAEFSSKYWVVAVDMRGYGDSDKPSQCSAYEIEHLVEDIKQMVLELGKEKCILMAHDWGGAIAWRVVNSHPDLFEHHISFNGPHPGAYMEHAKSSFKQMCMSWYMIFFRTPWVPEFWISNNDFEFFGPVFRGEKNNTEAFPNEVIDAYKYNYSKKGALTPPINYYRSIDFNRNDKISRTTVPTLIIWGTDDMALGKPMAAYALKWCESAQLKYIEGASHWVQQEEPDKVNSLVWEYLNDAAIAAK
ncbi:unnamed protein product [Meganyctiphanes norvegica]|uniref:AB hydrolase-1 domain-containing protein n=1 Tax=Meganyctiphanes norvegica TaxID=48144 RepID=A0AAV2QKT3_MEGNR